MLSLAAMNAQNEQVGIIKMVGTTCSGLHKGQRIGIKRIFDDIGIMDTFHSPCKYELFLADLNAALSEVKVRIVDESGLEVSKDKLPKIKIN